MKKYLYKAAATGDWVFGVTTTSYCPAGIHRLETKGTTEVKIINTHTGDDASGLLTTYDQYKNEAGNAYASLAAFVTATKDFFTEAGAAGATTDTLTDGTQKTQLVNEAGSYINPSGTPSSDYVEVTRPADTTAYTALDAMGVLVEEAQVETITLSGTAPTKKQDTITLSGAAPEKQVDTITLSGTAPEKQVDTVTLSGTAPTIQVDTITLTGTYGVAVISAAGGLTKTIGFSSDLTTTASNFVTAYAADYLAQNIVLTSSTVDLIFTSNAYGLAFTNPIITSDVGDLDGTVANTNANVVAVAQVDTVTLTGSSGAAIISAAGGLSNSAIYNTSLTQTAADFVTNQAADYLAVGIVVTSSGADIIFTAQTAGTGFTNPIITNDFGDLSGTVANTQANVAAEAQVDTITLTGASGEASVTLAGGLTNGIIFDTDLTTTAAVFVSEYAADYLAQAIVVTSSGADIIFTAQTAGTGFTSPAIANVPWDLGGSVVNTTPNVVVGQAEISAAGGLTKTVVFDTAGGIDLTDTAAAFVVSYAADYLAQGIVLTSSVADLIFTAQSYGVAFSSPIVTNTVGDLDGSVVNTNANIVVGQASITLAGGLTKTVVFDTVGAITLTATATAFKTSYEVDYLAQGIVLTSSGADLIFTAQNYGVAFVSPAIANTVGDLTGSVVNTNANVVVGQAEITVAGGLTKTVVFDTAGAITLTSTATAFVTAYAADYLAQEITLTSSNADLIFTSTTYGLDFDSPVITNTVGDLDGSIVNTTANVVVGTANITGAGGLTKAVVFDTAGAVDLTDTAAAFVVSYAADYLAQGITLTDSTGDLIFTATVAGVPFTSPVITNTAGDLDGVVVVTNANVTEGALEFQNMSITNGGGGYLMDLKVESNMPNIASTTVRVWFFNEAPNEVEGDNAAFLVKYTDKDKRLFYVDVVMDAQVGSSTSIVGQTSVIKEYNCAGTSLFATVQTIEGFTPTSGGKINVTVNVLKLT